MSEVKLLPLPEWYEACGPTVKRDMRAYARDCVKANLAQQPAAVDEAFVTRLADALIAKGWDVDPDCDGSGIVQLREAVIATQHQEPKS